ncbi:hypothetical protein CDAR_525451 [Caerostris darwini]|uniref:Uncharacterized protein n=1 Tax=Caerostris darwini TaxID=1538125 RepID=A0AAV4RPI5_9ARAC|nr:hypothetical protein CDAR_525451 [Caerostris darwini]
MLYNLVPFLFQGNLQQESLVTTIPSSYLKTISKKNCLLTLFTVKRQAPANRRECVGVWPLPHKRSFVRGLESSILPPQPSCSQKKASARTFTLKNLTIFFPVGQAGKRILSSNVANICALVLDLDNANPI